MSPEPKERTSSTELYRNNAYPVWVSIRLLALSLIFVVLMVATAATLLVNVIQSDSTTNRVLALVPLFLAFLCFQFQMSFPRKSLKAERLFQLLEYPPENLGSARVTLLNRLGVPKAVDVSIGDLSVETTAGHITIYAKGRRLVRLPLEVVSDNTGKALDGSPWIGSDFVEARLARRWPSEVWSQDNTELFRRTLPRLFG